MVDVVISLQKSTRMQLVMDRDIKVDDSVKSALLRFSPL
jgi:hypothetical protein